MKIIDFLRFEVITTVLLLFVVTVVLPALGVKEDVVWLAGIFVGVSSCMLCVIKVYFFQQKIDYDENINTEMENISRRIENIIPMFVALSKMKEPKFGYAKDVILKASQRVEEISEGIIRLDEPEYFNSIILETENMLENGVILAVNTFEERRFIDDPREKRFLEENNEAIKNRNVEINRIFIYDDTESDTKIRNERLSSIKMNFISGVNIFIVCKSALMRIANTIDDLYEDAVLFKHRDSSRLYIDYQDQSDETRVSHGELRLSDSEIERFERKFDTLKNMAISEQDMQDLLRVV
jgi:hypothetical protein